MGSPEAGDASPLRGGTEALCSANNKVLTREGARCDGTRGFFVALARRDIPEARQPSAQ